MRKDKLDWKSFGQFISTLVNLFALVRDTFAKVGVGIEIIPWVVGEGKQAFVREFLEPLSARFLAARPMPVLVRVMVDLGAFPKKPSRYFSVEDHRGTGLVPLEKRADGHLYLDGRKLILIRSDRQLNGNTIKGYDLKDELSAKTVPNANVLDAILEHPGLFPDYWKTDEHGNIGRFIYFWGTIYRGSDTHNLRVRCVCFGGSNAGSLGAGHGELEREFDGQRWAVIVS